MHKTLARFYAAEISWVRSRKPGYMERPSSMLSGAFVQLHGVYPIDRRVALSQLPQESGSPTRSTPTPYVPFCTPSKRAVLMPFRTMQPTTFTAAEIERYQARLLESDDPRYALWLEMFCPQSRTQMRPGVLETILQQPPKPAKQKAYKYPLDWLCSHK